MSQRDGLSAVFTACVVWVAVVQVNAIDDETLPEGHLQRLGAHRPREGAVIELDEVPHPIDFYEQYAKPGVPVILKGAGKSMPAYSLWTDKYLKEKSGKTVIQVEPGKKENRTRVAIEGHPAPFSKFLDVYNTSDIYMVDSVPKPLESDYHLLHCLLCGGYTTFLSMSNFWFSSGGTKSVLHNDDADNLNCVLSGEKEFFMADKKYEKTLPFTKSGHVELDVDAVDLLKVPQMREVKWWQAFIKEGDCLFIPHHWLHQVRSTGRNLAVNIWWYHLRRFNRSDCFVDGDEGKPRRSLPAGAAFSDFELKSGNSYRIAFLDMMDEQEKTEMTLKNVRSFTKEMLKSMGGEQLSRDEIREKAKALFDEMDANTNGLVDEDEVYRISADVFEEMFGEPDMGYNLENLGQLDDKKGSGVDDEEEADEDAEENAEEDGDTEQLEPVNLDNDEVEPHTEL